MIKATVDEGEGKDNGDGNNNNDGNDNDDDRESIDPYEEKVEDGSTKMPPTPPTATAGKTAGKTAAAVAKKKKDPTGVAGITQKLQTTSLQPQAVRFSFKAESPFLLSPTGIFNDGMRCICLVFFGIPMHKNKYKVELGNGIIVRL